MNQRGTLSYHILHKWLTGVNNLKLPSVSNNLKSIVEDIIQLNDELQRSKWNMDGARGQQKIKLLMYSGLLVLKKQKQVNGIDSIIFK